MSYENQSQVKSACVPCAVGHFATSAKLLGEAIRFKKEGLNSPQVLDDIAASLGEQNALERIDLTPAKIRELPEWEQNMAQMALDRSRELRHKLETIESMDALVTLAADVEEFYKYLNREWQSKRLDNCPTCTVRTKELKEALTHVEDVDFDSNAERRRKFIEEIQLSRKHK